MHRRVSDDDEAGSENGALKSDRCSREERGLLDNLGQEEGSGNDFPPGRKPFPRMVPGPQRHCRTLIPAKIWSILQPSAAFVGSDLAPTISQRPKARLFERRASIRPAPLSVCEGHLIDHSSREMISEMPSPDSDGTKSGPATEVDLTISLSELSDEDLVTHHLSGREGAFQELFDRYRDRLVHFITRKTGDGDRAQDLVQEAFIRVTRHLHRFDTSKKFSTWVYTIASNLSKNELRNRSRSPLVLFQKLTSNWDDDHRPLQFEDLTMQPDDLFRKRFLRRLVEDTVDELPEHHRLVFRLRELEGKSYEEIAEITGVNLGTVKSRLHRARNSFAQRIEHSLN